MAEYGNKYFAEFVDILGAKWRIDILIKDGGSGSLPTQIKALGPEPLIKDTKAERYHPFSPIFNTSITMSYYVDDINGGPDPETFIVIEEDTYMIEVRKDGELDFKGFIKADNNRFSWKPKPFLYTITASDFTFSRGTITDLNDVNLFLYGFITIGDFIKRTLFNSVGYDNPVLDILFNIKPDAISSDNITELLLHTDAFYSFDKGADFAYDALRKFMISYGARVFSSGGRYMMQRIMDIKKDDQVIIRITPDDVVGESISNPDNLRVLGPRGSDLMYYNQSPELIIGKALKQREHTYELKAINKINNFDWRTDTQSPFDNWEGDITGFYTRQGAGSLEDQFRIRIHRAAPSTFRSIWARIPIKVNQIFQVEAKAKTFLTLPAPSTINYNIYAKMVAVLVEVGEVGPIRYLDTGGNWQDYTDGNIGESEYYRISATPNEDQFGTLSIQSYPLLEIKEHPGVVDFEVLLVIIDSGISPEPPSGSDFYSELYPVFGKIFNKPYVSLNEKIVSPAKYSFIDDKDEKFFADTLDAGLSNTTFYDNGGTATPLPDKNWDGKNIDETVVKNEMDEQVRPSYSFEGDVISNNLSFHHCVVLKDKDNMRMYQMADYYSVKSCIHSVTLLEAMDENSGVGTYTVTPITKK